MAVVDKQWSGVVAMDETVYTMSRDSHTSSHRDLSATDQKRPSDYNIQPGSEATRTREASIQASNSTVNRNRSGNASTEDWREESAEAVDDSSWIHRDKLAQIEIQEMEQAGIHPRQPRGPVSRGPEKSAQSSRSASRSGARRAVSKERVPKPVQDGHAESQHTSHDDHQRSRVPTIVAADEEQQGFNLRAGPEQQTPETAAAAARHHAVRPSTSRIPISKSSPVPVPQTVVDRDSPLPRSRNGSGAWSGGAWNDTQYARRARSESVESHTLLQPNEGDNTSPPRPTSSSTPKRHKENSPPKARMPSESTPISGARKTANLSNGAPRSVSSRTNKVRVGSGSAPKRATSRSGQKPRTSTSNNAPEGEAPWIASMYKPDPRLPPDQQMLPTHAKRMMQEQWEKEGKTGTAYDRDFNLLNDEKFHERTPQLPIDSSRQSRDAAFITSPSTSPSQLQNPDRSSPVGAEPWPLSRTKSRTPDEAETPHSETSGGYKITPTIPKPASILRSGSLQDVSSQPPHNPTPRLPDLDEKEPEKPKKNCCCVVM